MNVADFTYFLKNPSKVVAPIHTKHLEDIIEEYPYFQAARALHLKGLKNLNSYKYNKALKITAAYTSDREVLFKFITATNFLQDQQGITEEAITPNENKEEKNLPVSSISDTETKTATNIAKNENTLSEEKDATRPKIDSLPDETPKSEAKEVVKEPLSEEELLVSQKPEPTEKQTKDKSPEAKTHTALQKNQIKTKQETSTSSFDESKKSEVTKKDTSVQKEGASLEEKAHLIEESEDKPLPQDEKDAEQILDPALFTSKTAIEKIEEDTQKTEDSLSITNKEKYSFSEWLTLASQKSTEQISLKEVEKEKTTETETETKTTNSAQKKEKFDLIDKFIASNPKIKPTPQNNAPAVDISKSTKIDQTELMTETLARVYLDQKKYKKAIQAYKILSLKYPEKSSFFADRIKLVEKIKKENT